MKRASIAKVSFMVFSILVFFVNGFSYAQSLFEETFTSQGGQSEVVKLIYSNGKEKDVFMKHQFTPQSGAECAFYMQLRSTKEGKTSYYYLMRKGKEESCKGKYSQTIVDIEANIIVKIESNANIYTTMGSLVLEHDQGYQVIDPKAHTNINIVERASADTIVVKGFIDKPVVNLQANANLVKGYTNLWEINTINGRITTFIKLWESQINYKRTTVTYKIPPHIKVLVPKGVE